MTSTLEHLLLLADKQISAIAQKVTDGHRLSANEGLTLYQSNDLGLLGALACYVKRQKSGDEVYVYSFKKTYSVNPVSMAGKLTVQ